MNKTPNYNLSQWDMTDRIEMKDFNADNAAVEAALTALAAKDADLAGELAKKALASDLKSQISDLSSSKLQLDTLLDTSFTASGSSYSIPLTGLGRCIIAMAVFSSVSLPDRSLPYINSATTSYHHLLGEDSYSSGLSPLLKGHANYYVFFPMKQSTELIHGISFAYRTFGFFYGAAQYGSLTNLTIRPPSGTSSLSGGAKLQVYGVR